MPKVAKDHIISLTHYCKVVQVMGDTLKVKNLHNGMDFSIIGKDLIDKVESADDFDEAKTEKLSRTELLEKFIGCGDKPFTIHFKKAEGDPRTLRGRMIGPEPLLGRSLVEDLDEDKNKNRLVDHRTVEWLILGGVKYVVKGK